MRGYKTVNDESHACTYCDEIVNKGEGVLLKYADTQTDESIIIRHETDRVAHKKCVREQGLAFEKRALFTA